MFVENHVFKTEMHTELLSLQEIKDVTDYSGGCVLFITVYFMLNCLVFLCYSSLYTVCLLTECLIYPHILLYSVCEELVKYHHLFKC